MHYPLIDAQARKAEPKPVRVDLRIIFLIITALWIVASIVCGVLLLLHMSSIHRWYICLAGVGIGVILLIWEHFDRWDYRRLGV